VGVWCFFIILHHRPSCAWVWCLRAGPVLKAAGDSAPTRSKL